MFNGDVVCESEMCYVQGKCFVGNWICMSFDYFKLSYYMDVDIGCSVQNYNCVYYWQCSLQYYYWLLKLCVNKVV